MLNISPAPQNVLKKLTRVNLFLKKKVTNYNNEGTSNRK